MSGPGWIGVDLDGTLAEYDGWVGARHIGKPVPLMVERIKRWANEGRLIKIFTARCSVEDSRELVEVLQTIHEWCVEHLGWAPEVTCKKDFNMIELWDDRAVQVIPNTGQPVGESTRGL